MASKSSKQEYYRRLMKEKKSKSSSIQRIDHPLAKYNQLDQLSCVVCNTIVKSDLLWKTHLQSKQHKEKVLELKSLKTTPKVAPKHQQPNRKTSTNPQEDVPLVLPVKRHSMHDVADEEHSIEPKKAKTNESISDTAVKLKGLPDDFFDAENDEMETNTDADPQPSSSHSTSLPTDFFDPPSNTIDNNSDPVDQKQSDKNSSESHDIPEGFFDDPKVDAKKRNVEYKDPQDSAWENFQKTISKETEVSEAIVEEGDEVMQDDRELTELNEQVACFQKAEELRLKQEQLHARFLIKTEPGGMERQQTAIAREDSSEEDDSLDLDDLLDWRFRTT